MTIASSFMSTLATPALIVVSLLLVSYFGFAIFLPPFHLNRVSLFELGKHPHDQSLGEHLMHERDDNPAFAHSGCNALALGCCGVSTGNSSSGDEPGSGSEVVSIRLSSS